MMFKNVIKKYQDIFFYKVLEKKLLDCSSVLDLGCGSDSPLGKAKRKFYSEGVDIFEQSIAQSKKKKTHNKYITADVLDIDKYYQPKTFDAVIALDLIEHLEKRSSLKVIKKMERIAKKKVIILTPNGFYHQDHLEGNPHQEHKSGWLSADLESLGYKVCGLRGLKYIRGEYATIAYKPWILWGAIALISEPILYFFPKYSYHLFAVKSFYNEKNKYYFAS